MLAKVRTFFVVVDGSLESRDLVLSLSVSSSPFRASASEWKASEYG